MEPGGSATLAQLETAYSLGYAIASTGRVVLIDGRHVGMVDAACPGSQSEGGLTRRFDMLCYIKPVVGIEDHILSHYPCRLAKIYLM